MKIQFHVGDMIVADKDKDLISKKLLKLKRYLQEEPAIIDVYITDEAGGPNKRGVDKSVKLSVDFKGEKIFVEEVDSVMMRSFAHVFKRFEHQLDLFHDKRIGKGRTIPRRIRNSFDFFFRKK